ncbi:hypothetical protein [Curtobacterium sp. 9128]|uniref:hypothetical protein n=1 Tax=Curtobacterium sp. 9128 TaxID=1793722 RepID=UPI001642EC03|nr:hypothetical protein [Curtobacterium sp. 9128]
MQRKRPDVAKKLRLRIWFNHRRLPGELGMVPPVEFEHDHYRHAPAPTTVEAALPSLH